MSDKKVKISNILGSQIPDFIQADNPLFKEFLTQYYESEEREYGTTYLADHISSLKKISTVSDISLVEKGGNIQLYFIPENQFVQILPSYIPTNWGFFWVLLVALWAARSTPRFAARSIPC